MANLRELVDWHSQIMKIWLQVVVLCNLDRRVHFTLFGLGGLALLGFLLCCVLGVGVLAGQHVDQWVKRDGIPTDEWCGFFGFHRDWLLGCCEELHGKRREAS